MMIDQQYILLKALIALLYTIKGPILHPAQFTFYTDTCFVASLHPAKDDFPPQQTRATTLAPGEACSGANWTRNT